MQKKLYLGTNTKMYKTIAQTVDFLKELGDLTRDVDRKKLELFVIPSFTTLAAAAETARQGGIKLGAQNMGWEDQGQFTGEVSPVMLEEAGVQVVCIGHSERRHVLGESDQEENKKVQAALRHNFTALLCIGETAEQKQYGIEDEVLRTQIKIGLYNTTPEQASRIWIGYEPVWAIGVNGTPASAEHVARKHDVIRQALVELYGPEAGKKVPILYGGSVNNENARELIKIPDIDGLFIGRSAWDAKNFSKIIHEMMGLANPVGIA